MTANITDAMTLPNPIFFTSTGWSGRSQMNLKYEHWFGNESSQSLLEAYGVLPQDNQTREMLKPKQCPNCNDYMDLSAHNEEPLLILYNQLSPLQ
jgi:hypothetical protein